MNMELLSYLGTGFLGGIILNVMPCVLPVLTMKVFHIVEHGAEDPRSNRRHGMAYTAGVLFAFACFAGVIIALKATGEMVGWGIQFQNPAFVAFLSGLMVVLALNALGVFEFAISVSVGGDEDSVSASFVNGIIASVMATPCSAPFLGTAAAFALAKGTPGFITMLMFLAIGLGLAFPFAVISFVPALSRMLPRPGLWMETLKKLMGFSLLAAAVWLFGVLMGQVNSDSSLWFLGYLLVVALGLWSMEHFGGLKHTTARRIGVRIGVAALLVYSGWEMLEFEPKESSAAKTVSAGESVVVEGAINWSDFSANRVALENKRKRPVFVDYTADWCLNCKTNEKLFLETDAVRKALLATSILPMKADWTNEDETITEWLEKLGRTGIPAYAIYYPDGKVDLLPEVITKEMVVSRLSKAGQQFPSGGYLALEEVCGVAN